jgi:hypothetical protein
MRVFFFASHTLYLKVCIPLVVALAQKGVRVTLWQSRPHLLGYHPKRYGAQPGQNVCVNRAALSHVARVIGYEQEVRQVDAELRYAFLRRVVGYDAVVGTTKDMEILLQMHAAGCPRVYVLGYEHYPVFLSIGREMAKGSSQELCEEVFLGDNLFTQRHRFDQVIRHPKVSAHRFLNFLYLDKVYQRGAETAGEEAVRPDLSSGGVSGGDHRTGGGPDGLLPEAEGFPKSRL